MRSKTKVQQHILLICNDVVGTRLAGPAIRYVEMAKALAKHHIVTLVVPAGSELDSLSGLRILTDSPRVVYKAVKKADFVIFQGNALVKYPKLKIIEAVLIADLYCPIPLEYHQSAVDVAADAHMQTAVYLAKMMAEQLIYADHFMCASERQRDFWLGGLAITGRINGLRWPNASHANLDELISLVPFGLPDEPPKKTGPGLRMRFGIPAEDFVAIWGGGIYQWFDPVTPIRAVHRLVAKGRRIHLVFMGIKHPNPDIHEHDRCLQAIRLSNELGLTDRFVHFNFGWVDYDCRQNFFLEADVGISAHFDNPETRFAFRTRMLDYLWCSLPIVATRGDVFAESIKTHELGMVIEVEDVDNWCNAFQRMQDNTEFRLRCQQNVGGFSKTYTWSSILQRFLQNIEQLTVAADRNAIRKLAMMRYWGPGLGAKLRQAYAEGGWDRVRNLTRRRLGIFFRTPWIR